MNRNDLKVGQEYAHDTSNGWRKYTSATRVRVVSLDRYRRDGYSWNGRVKPDPKGNLVHVERLAANGDPVAGWFVPPAQLRITWDEYTTAHVPAVEAARSELDGQRRTQAQAERNTRDAIVDALLQLGVPEPIKFDRDKPTHVVLSPDQFWSVIGATALATRMSVTTPKD